MSVFDTSTWHDCEAELKRMYSADGRFYHNLSHVEDCLRQLKSVPEGKCEDREAVQLALWFHDAIYDPHRSDNEAASADLAAEWLEKMELLPSRIDVVRQLIQATDHRTPPRTPDQVLIVDIDLSILGREAATYERYAGSIRQEYGHVPDAEYRAGRSAVLRSFLERERIFGTEWFAERYEETARRNVAGEIAALNCETAGDGNELGAS